MNASTVYNNLELLDRSYSNEPYTSQITACLNEADIDEKIDLTTIDFTMPGIDLRMVIFSRMKDAGYTLQRIGEIVDLSGGRISGLLQKYKRRLDNRKASEERQVERDLSLDLSFKDLDDELSCDARKRQFETGMIRRMCADVLKHKPLMNNRPVMLGTSVIEHLAEHTLKWHEKGATIQEIIKAFTWMYRLFDQDRNINKDFNALTIHEERRQEQLMTVIQKEHEVSAEWAALVKIVLQNAWPVRSR